MNQRKEYLRGNHFKMTLAKTFTVCAIVICLFYSVGISATAENSASVITDSKPITVTFSEGVTVSDEEISKRIQAEIEIKQFADEFKEISDEFKGLSVELQGELKELGVELQGELKDLKIELKTKLSKISGE